MLKKEEETILKEVYDRAHSGMDSIHAIIGKVYDDDLALDLNRQAYHYSKISEKALNKLYENGCRRKREASSTKQLSGAVFR